MGIPASLVAVIVTNSCLSNSDTVGLVTTSLKEKLWSNYYIAMYNSCIIAFFRDKVTM